MNVYVLQLARKLGARGVKVDVYTRYHDPNDPQVVPLSRNARVIHLQAGPYDERKHQIYSHLPHFIQQLQQFRIRRRLTYDLVHTHYWLSSRVGNVLARQWGVPHITTFHTLAEVKRRARVGEKEPLLRIQGERCAVARADRIIALSTHEREALVRFYDANPSKVVIIPCGVDTHLFQPVDRAVARQYVNVSLDGQTILYVGRIEPLKGLDLLLHAMARLEPVDDMKLLVVGGSSNGDRQACRLRRLARDLGIAQRVRFQGALPQEVLPYYYSAADVAVVPSYYESFGLVALEAMACGTPVIASRVGGLQSVVHDGQTGYLVPWRCPESYSQRLEMLLASEPLRRAMGRTAHAVASQMDWASVAQRVEKEYLDLLGARSVATASRQ